MALAAGQALGGRARRAAFRLLTHVFVLVLENHNAFTSFGSPGILDNPAAPHISAFGKAVQFCLQLQRRLAPEACRTTWR